MATGSSARLKLPVTAEEVRVGGWQRPRGRRVAPAHTGVRPRGHAASCSTKKGVRPPPPPGSGPMAPTNPSSSSAPKRSPSPSSLASSCATTPTACSTASGCAGGLTGGRGRPAACSSLPQMQAHGPKPSGPAAFAASSSERERRAPRHATPTHPGQLRPLPPQHAGGGAHLACAAATQAQQVPHPPASLSRPGAAAG
jgi:hypothetical protein